MPILVLVQNSHSHFEYFEYIQTMKVADPIEPTEDDQEFAAQAVRRFLPKTPAQANVIQIGRAEITNVQNVPWAIVPAHIAALFQQILVLVASGKAVTIVPHDRMLSTQDAADLLNVSRPFLIKLLEQENVPIQRVGNRRRIAFPDVLKLKEKLRKRSDEAFHKLAELDEELGIES